MAEIESAEEFADTMDGCAACKDYCFDQDEAVKLIAVRDTAIREAARLEGKREALFELKRLVETSKWLDLANRKESGWGRAYQAAMKELETKYQSADSQPAQDGERR